MNNNTELKEILKRYNVSGSFSRISNIEWKTQDSNESSILFYNLNDGKDELKKFKERIAESKYALCVVNNELDVKINKVFSVSRSDYEILQEDLLNFFYPIDMNEIYCAGVTGTNGKTTTIDLVRQICIQQDINVLTCGTLGVYLNDDKKEYFSLTSPSYIDLRKILYKYKGEYKCFAMELSSHALDQHRYGSLRFDRIAWTNFTQDHLDYHKTMEEYFKAKFRVFNILRNNGHVYIAKTESELLERIKQKEKLKLVDPISGPNLFFSTKYNQVNLALAKNLVEPLLKDEIYVEKLNAPPGRLNIQKYGSALIIVDYAHTPEGLSSICKELKKSFSKRKLITVFGCGGDRDKSKRKLMAMAACRYSDNVIVTSDNPRFENPKEIIKDITVGLSGEYKIIEDRKEAIKYALENAVDDVILIAGKGHEDYMDVRGFKHPYSDLEYIKELVNDSARES